MTSTLYVANLSHTVERNELDRLFAGHGAVRSFEVINQIKAASSTSAVLVEMDSNEHAVAAIVALNGVQHRGGPLIVGWANSEHAGGVESQPMFEPTNVPGDGEGRELPGAPHRARLPMQP